MKRKPVRKDKRRTDKTVLRLPASFTLPKAKQSQMKMMPMIRGQGSQRRLLYQTSASGCCIKNEGSGYEFAAGRQDVRAGDEPATEFGSGLSTQGLVSCRM